MNAIYRVIKKKFFGVHRTVWVPDPDSGFPVADPNYISYFL